MLESFNELEDTTVRDQRMDTHDNKYFHAVKYLNLSNELLDLQMEMEKLKLYDTILSEHYQKSQECKDNILNDTYFVVGEIDSVVDDANVIVTASNKNGKFLVKILVDIDKAVVKPGASVKLLRDTYAIVGVLPEDSDTDCKILGLEEIPSETFSMIGGLEQQKLELREAVELPLTNPELFTDLGIDSPRGVLLYGPPGCGKTMLARAVAHHTQATFLRFSGSEFVRKYLGEGPKLVRDAFKVAKLHAPSIIFIDEVDAIAMKRTDGDGGATSLEVQRILIELLNQMDGFDKNDNVKVIMATNRMECLDPAILRPGRLDRKIEFPLPDAEEKLSIFKTIAAKMNIGSDVNFLDFATKKNDLSPAEIKGLFQEAGYMAIRDKRELITHEDFEKAYKKCVKTYEEDKIQYDFYT